MHSVCKTLLIWAVFLCSMSVFAQQIPSESNVCKVNEAEILLTSHTLALSIKQGRNTLYLDCNIQVKSVLTLPAIGLNSIIVNVNNATVAKSILSTKRSYVLSPGEQSINIELVAEQSRQIKMQLSEFSQFHTKSMSHNTVMSLYIGVCIALALYVGLLGRGIKNTGFYAYSAYLVSLTVFFGIQEGIFNYFFNDLNFINTRASQSVVAGIVVFTATLFISRLLDFKLLLNRNFNRLIMSAATAILVFGFAITITPLNIATLLEPIMGWSTLVLVFIIFCIAGYAAINRVHTANLIFIGLSTVLFGMIFRIWLTDLSEFLHRYALVIGLSLIHI